MSLFQTIAASRMGFVIINLILVIIFYSQIGEPLPFFIAGSGVIVMAFFIRRLIAGFTGEKT